MKKNNKFFSEIAGYYYELSDLIREVISIIIGIFFAGITATVMLFTVFDPLVIFFDNGRPGEPVDSAIAAILTIAAIATVIGAAVMGIINPSHIDFTIFEEYKIQEKTRKHREKLKAQLQLREEYQKSCEYLTGVEVEADVHEYAYGKMSDAERKKLYRLLKVDMD